MGNSRYQTFPKSGPAKPKGGTRHDNVGPMKTKNWPGVPGPAPSNKRNAGFEKKKQGLADKGL